MLVAAGVVGDLRIGALLVLAARDMTAERCRAAVLDRRHHLELAEAHMAGIGLTPCRAVVAEDIRDLQSWTRHARRTLAGWPHLLELQGDMLQWAPHLLDRFGGNPRIECRVLELGVTEQNLDDPNVGVSLEQMGGEAVPQRVRRHVLLNASGLCGSMAGAIELTCGHRLHGITARKQPASGPCH